jgi:DNA-binding transcriptional regulator LsrR (DeoR family)
LKSLTPITTIASRLGISRYEVEKNLASAMNKINRYLADHPEKKDRLRELLDYLREN